MLGEKNEDFRRRISKRRMRLQKKNASHKGAKTRRKKKGKKEDAYEERKDERKENKRSFVRRSHDGHI